MQRRNHPCCEANLFAPKEAYRSRSFFDIRRQSSEIRTRCANQRASGSEEGWRAIATPTPISKSPQCGLSPLAGVGRRVLLLVNFVEAFFQVLLVFLLQLGIFWRAVDLG